jgi:hypothetical protein
VVSGGWFGRSGTLSRADRRGSADGATIST